MSFAKNFQLPESVKPGVIQDPNSTKFVETDALKRIYEIGKLLENERASSVVLNTPVGGVSNAVLNKILLCSICCTICVIVWLWVHNHRTIKRHHRKMVNTIEIHIDKKIKPEAYPEIETASITRGELEAKERIIMSYLKTSLPSHETCDQQE